LKYDLTVHIICTQFYSNKTDNSTWKRNEMKRRWFWTIWKYYGHKNQAQKSGQTKFTKYSTNIPAIEYSDISISVKISSAWWLAKEDVAIYKFDSLVTTKLLSHGYKFSIQLLKLLLTW